MKSQIFLPFGSDARFTLNPTRKDTGEPLTESDMLDLKVKIVNKKTGQSFVPHWKWTMNGIEMEVLRENIPAPMSYKVNLYFYLSDPSYSKQKKKIHHYCSEIIFVDDCEVEGDEGITVQVGSRHAIINLVEELPEKGTPGEYYATLIENAGG